MNFNFIVATADNPQAYVGSGASDSVVELHDWLRDRFEDQVGVMIFNADTNEFLGGSAKP